MGSLDCEKTEKTSQSGKIVMSIGTMVVGVYIRKTQRKNQTNRGRDRTSRKMVSSKTNKAMGSNLQ